MTTLGALGASQIAAAEGTAEPIHLEYQAPPGCPGEADFVARVRARTSRARFVSAEAQRRTFVVELSAGGRPTGSVTVLDGVRTQGARRFDSDTCEGVADALALIVALALDPRARASSASLHAPAALEVDAQAAVGEGLDGGGAADAEPISVVARALDAGVAARPLAALADASAPAPPPPVPRSTPIPPSPPVGTEGSSVMASALWFHVFGGADLAVATSLAPTTIFAGAPYLGWRSTRAGLLGPSFRLAFLRAGTGALAVTGGRADFTLTVGRLDACAMLWPGGALRIGACARAEVGVFDVSGLATGGTGQTQHSPWVATAALARLEWTLLGPLLLDVSGGPDFHITAHSFFFQPGPSSVNGYDVPVVGFATEAGLGVHFL